ncbi:hypothetical protein C8R41DRAFT_291948 [Lentinula lateritia]|uniref:DUF7330 domain-containing protein n=1 Tax=Lentinula lateritia TaxID=40482 RepID=A0ABQ8VL37_9AGAR|nr:hypothetical protein C8R41DRAFT_291948 [Lentinula lateritia]
MIIPTKELDDSEYNGKLDDDSPTETGTVRGVDSNKVEPPPEYSPPNPYYPDKQKKSTYPEVASKPSDDLELKGVNFVYRHIYFDSIYATYIIDPSVQDLSQSILPGASRDDRRLGSRTGPRKGKTLKNLCLQSECGAINVGVRVLDTEIAAMATEGKRSHLPRKVLLDVRATFGPIDVRLRLGSLPPPPGLQVFPESTATRLPIKLSASSKCGPVHISLPASFYGFIFFSVPLGEIVLSTQVQKNVSWDRMLNRSIQKNSGARTVFVGDSEALRGRIEGGSKPSASSKGDTRRSDGSHRADVDGPWNGDEVHLDAWCGSVLVDYVDE